jgi:hypothetical protein
MKPFNTLHMPNTRRKWCLAEYAKLSRYFWKACKGGVAVVAFCVTEVIMTEKP